MLVVLDYLGPIRSVLNQEKDLLAVEDGGHGAVTLRDVFEHVAAKYGQSAGSFLFSSINTISPRVHVQVNGRNVSQPNIGDTTVVDGDEISIFVLTPFQGG